MKKKEAMSKESIIYILSNPCMPNLVKIGKTTRKNIGDRMKQLFTTGVPLPFECEYACTVENCDEVEKQIHKGFKKYRLTESREFFEIEAEDVIAILKLVALKNVTPNFIAEIESNTTPEEKDRINQIKKKRPKLNFIDLGIPKGSVLQFFRGDHEVVVYSEKKVFYNDEIRSLTSVTRELLGIDRDVAPSPRWYFEGKKLKDIYDEYHT